MDADADSNGFTSNAILEAKKESEAAGYFWWSKGLNGVVPSGCGNQIGVKRVKGLKEQKGQGNKGIRRAKRVRRARETIEGKENRGLSLFLSQIIDFALVHFVLALAQPVF